MISLPAFIWWAAGINQLPFQIALFFGLHSHVTYLRTKQVRYVVATLAWTLFGLLFYEKTLLVYMMYDVRPVEPEDWRSPPFGSGVTTNRGENSD